VLRRAHSSNQTARADRTAPPPPLARAAQVLDLSAGFSTTPLDAWRRLRLAAAARRPPTDADDAGDGAHGADASRRGARGRNDDAGGGALLPSAARARAAVVVACTPCPARVRFLEHLASSTPPPPPPPRRHGARLATAAPADDAALEIVRATLADLSLALSRGGDGGAARASLPSSSTRRGAPRWPSVGPRATGRPRRPLLPCVVKAPTSYVARHHHPLDVT